LSVDADDLMIVTVGATKPEGSPQNIGVVADDPDVMYADPPLADSDPVLTDVDRDVLVAWAVSVKTGKLVMIM
jgi:hypothetical protein